MPRTIYSKGYRKGEMLFDWGSRPAVAISSEPPYRIIFATESDDEGKAEPRPARSWDELHQHLLKGITRKIDELIARTPRHKPKCLPGAYRGTIRLPKF